MLKKVLLSVLIWSFICVYLCNLCFSKNLEKRTGIGFNTQISDYDIGNLSVRHWFSKKMGVEALLGFSIGDDTLFNFGCKFLSILKTEQNMNIYGFGMAGAESYQIEQVVNSVKVETDDTSVKIGGGFGVEFFIIGLDNLGFGCELGIGFSDINDKGQFGTTAEWLSSVGVRYYL